jgi:Xaa-Pro aminopeptidase
VNRQRHAQRIERAEAEAAAQGFDAVVASPSPDLAYLTGYDPGLLERPTFLVLRPDREPLLLVPELERPLATSRMADDVVAIRGWRDGTDPYAEAAASLPSRGRIAVTDRMWSSHLLELQAVLPEISFHPASPVIGRLRARKDPDELDALRRAAAAADRTYEDLCGLAFRGRTEIEIAADLARLLVEHGHTRADFTIVGAGPNGASPHHDPGERRVEEGDAVVLDFGGELDGYFSDTTRTVVAGEPSTELVRIHALVHHAQGAAVDAVRPGAVAQDIDRIARAIIEEGGEGERFIHRTGHGIGREVHEPPYIVEGNPVPLEPGMVFSVEPGVYLAGRFGVRIEDIVAVTDEGVETLNRSSRDLAVVG